MALAVCFGIHVCLEVANQSSLGCWSQTSIFCGVDFFSLHGFKVDLNLHSAFGI